MSELNLGLVYTNKNCTGCNKCISICPTILANHSVYEEGKNKILVNDEACIQCGECMNICRHNAREYKDDTKQFFEDLNKGEKISLLVAPSFIANYPKQYNNILGYLKSKGINRIISVSFGADITTWGYLNYITKYNFKGGISQPCPVIVKYIEKYLPELIPKLIPVHSPVMCSAIYAKKYMNISDKFAFISPCIAKKSEIMRPENRGYIDYNITFLHLMQAIKNIDISKYDVKDEIEYGLGSIYPQPGGLKENVEYFLGKDIMIRQVEGERHVYKFLNEYLKRVKQNKPLPFMVDALNCANGCIYGTATEPENKNNDDILFEIHNQKIKKHNKRKSPWNSELEFSKRLKYFNQQFSNLKLEDFLCKYHTNDAIKLNQISDAKINQVFKEMNKDTKEKQSIDCGACGYESCYSMATAISHGFNKKENCIYFLKNELEKEKTLIENMTRKLEEKQKHKEILYQEILEKFEKIKISMEELTSGNSSSVNDIITIGNEVGGMVEFTQKLKSSIINFSETIKEYNKINNSIISISNRTGMLALNTGIESARSGAAGRGFTVIANQIKILSEQTKKMVEDGRQQSDILLPAIEKLDNEIIDFAKSINHINEKTSDLTTNSEEIAAKAVSVEKLVNKILVQMKEVVMK